MAGGADKRARQARRALKARGFVVEMAGGGHYTVSHPAAPGRFSMSATPRSAHFERKLEADARRLLAGRLAPGKRDDRNEEGERT